ncbi:MAG: hypothetical protein INQ03_01650 [Candidatus Heimdallarchaeota archaeon]|nr:hypothetical protein [Candidatus Heimdallarchaeota archaeon]
MVNFQSLNNRIEKKNWDHLDFLKRMTVVLLLIIFMFYAWILIGSINGLFEQEFVQLALKDISLSLFIGIAAGIIIGFIELIWYYIHKNWDLHVVVPNYLMMHLITTMVGVVILYMLSPAQLMASSGSIGFILGGMIAIIAYAGEIKREHSSPDEDSIKDT